MLSERLKTLRKKQHLSQMALSKFIGVSQQTIGSWETGRTSPDNNMITALAKHFNVSTDYLLGNSPIPNNINIDTNNDAISDSGYATIANNTNISNNKYQQIIGALFGSTPDVVDVFNRLKITPQGDIDNIDMHDKATIKMLAQTMINALKNAQARNDSN